MALDFSTLSDDQLAELFRELLQEAVARKCKDAFESIYLDEAQKLRIAQEASAAEVARLQNEEAQRVAAEAAEAVRREAAQKLAATQRENHERAWGKKRVLALSAIRLLGKANLEINVWEKSGDVRLYINDMDSQTRRKSAGAIITYYRTGTTRKRPGSIELFNCAASEGAVLDFCNLLFSQFQMVRIDTLSALTADERKQALAEHVAKKEDANV